MKGQVPPKDRTIVFNNLIVKLSTIIMRINLIADITFWLSWSTWKMTNLGNRAIGDFNLVSKPS